MKKILLFFLVFYLLQCAYSQTYRLQSAWNGSSSCSGGAYYSEFYHSTTIYDIDGNVLDQINYGVDQISTSYTNTFTVRPYKVKHIFDCQH